MTPPSFHVRLPRALVATLVLLALGVAAAVVLRRPLARWAFSQTLTLVGLEGASFVVEEIDLQGLALREVRVGSPPDLAIDGLEVAYSLAGLRAGRLDALAVHGLRLRGAATSEGLSFGALDAWLAGEERGAAAGPFAILPVDRLEISDARVEIETPEGPASADLALELDEFGDGSFTLVSSRLGALDSGLGLEVEPFSLAGRVSLRGERREVELAPAPFALRVRRGGETERVEGGLPAVRLALRPGQAEAARIEASGGSLRLPGRDLELSGFGVEAELRAPPELFAGRVSVETIRVAAPGMRVPPLRLDARVEPRDGSLGFEASLHDPAGPLRLTARGSWQPDVGALRAELELAPLRFGPQGIDPAVLFPLLAPLISETTGVVEARGQVAGRAGELQGSLDVGLRDLSLSSGTMRIECVNALIRLDGPWPPRTPPGQALSMARLDVGLELTDGLLSYRLSPSGELELERAEWQLAGGRVITAGRFDPSAAEQHLLLAVEGVDLAKLLARVDLEGLTGTGRVGGHLPIVWRGDVLEVRDGILATDAEGGWIRYRPSGASKLAGLGVSQLEDLGRALENFRYERLVLRLNGETAGPIVVSLQLAGANPDYRDAQPYDLNLRVEARLGDLLQQGSVAYEIPRRVEQKLANRFGAAPPAPPGDPCSRRGRSGPGSGSQLDSPDAQGYARRPSPPARKEPR